MIDHLKKPLIILALVSIVTMAAISTAIFFYPKIITTDNLEINSAELISLTNQYRHAKGLNTLVTNPRLTQAAINKARDILSGQYFDHSSPQGKKFSDWIKEVNYQYFYVGENLAIDFASDKELFQAWVNSPKHQENLISPQYQEIGIAAIKGKFKNHPTIVVVQLFGSRVLGASSLIAAASANNDLTKNYFYPENNLENFISLDALDRLHQINNLLLVIIIGLLLIIYNPEKKNSQTKINRPATKRYQAKTLKE